MISPLYKSHAREASLCHTIKNILHQLSPDAAILDSRIDRDGTYASYDRALIEEVAADNLAVQFCDDSIETRMAKQLGKQTHASCSRRQIRRKVMLFGDFLECLVTDCTTASSVFSFARS